MRRLHPMISWLLVTLLALGAALAFAQEAAPVPDASRPAAQGNGGPADPATACYDAARTGGREAYQCDLAVRMARDSGDPAALTAALANRSLVLSAAGRLEAAISDIDEALTLAPESADLHGNRGNLLLRLARPGEALTAHDRAVELSPEDPLGYYNRAFSFLALGQPRRADQDLAAARMLAGGAAAISPAGTPGVDARRDR